MVIFFSGKLPHCRNMGWISKEPRLRNVEGTDPIHFHGASAHTGVLLWANSPAPQTQQQLSLTPCFMVSLSGAR